MTQVEKITEQANSRVVFKIVETKVVQDLNGNNVIIIDDMKTRTVTKDFVQTQLDNATYIKSYWENIKTQIDAL